MTRETEETRIALLEQNHQQMMEKIDTIIERFDKFEVKLDKALEKKANKWVETAMYWGFTSVGVVAIGLLVRWVILLDLGK